jgi:uncharacterized protein (UPF0335 family)
MSEIGHNGVAADELRQIVERVERLEEEKAGIAGDIKEVFAEAKGRGFDTKIIRKVIAIRKRDRAEIEEEQAILDLYMQALGMLADTPLGEAAVRREARRARDVQVDLEDAIAGLGRPVEPTEEERAKGVTLAFDKNGTRMTLTMPEPVCG